VRLAITFGERVTGVLHPSQVAGYDDPPYAGRENEEGGARMGKAHVVDIRSFDKPWTGADNWGRRKIMTMNMTVTAVGLALSVILSAGAGLAADPAEVEKYVRARIDIGEMMTNYFKDGETFGQGQAPSEEKRREMGKDINAKVAAVLSKYGLTVEEYRAHSKDVFADEASVKRFLNEHPDLKQRYEALPLDRMGRGGSTGRGY
jgi:hypothetical protein